MKKIIFAFILFIPIFGNSQNTVQADFFAKGEKLFLKSHFKAALSEYVLADSVQPKNVLITFRIAACELNIGKKSTALKKLLALEPTANKLPIEYYFYLGKSYHLNYEFTQSMSMYIKYREMLVNQGGKQQKIIADLDRFIDQVKFAQKLYSNPIKINVKPISEFVNTSFAEYSPIVTLDEKKLYFTSRRPENVGGKKDPIDDDFYEDIYVSEKSEIGWSLPKNVGNSVNSDNHDAVVGISEDGQKMFVYKNTLHEIGGKQSGDIFYSELIGDRWETPVAFENGINTVYFEPSASINANENMIFFASDKPGGYGGTDIYVTSLLPNGKWTNPKNLGNKINTSENDDSPFLMPDGKVLYFTSEGHLGMGGHDIFYSKLDTNGNWSSPVNLGYPINSPDDDIYFSWSADGNRIYFSSIREEFGKTNSDIYVGEFVAKNEEHVVMLKGKVQNRITKEPLKALIKVFELANNKLVGVHHSNSISGDYQLILPEGINYRVVVEKDNYLFNSLNLNVPESKSYVELSKDLYLDTVFAGRSIYLRNVFFANNSNDIQIESSSELDALVEVLEKNPHLYIELMGNIDDINDKEHNKFLSESRAVVISEYLTKHGIDETRIISVGCAEITPTNANIEEMIEHLVPEVKIISNSAHKYNKVSPRKVIEKEPLINTFKVGYYLKEHVYFPENESTTLHTFSKAKINHIANLMKQHPNLKLKIEAHYDESVDAKHNLHLATAREKIVLDALIQQGIESNRVAISLKTDGEMNITNANHEKLLINRKINFKVIAY